MAAIRLGRPFAPKPLHGLQRPLPRTKVRWPGPVQLRRQESTSPRAGRTTVLFPPRERALRGDRASAYEQEAFLYTMPRQSLRFAEINILCGSAGCTLQCPINFNPSLPEAEDGRYHSDIAR